MSCRRVGQTASGTARNNLGTAKGKRVQGLFISKFGYPLVKLLWLSTRKTERNPNLYLQDVLSFPEVNHKLLGWL